jgi:hypothetical protein
MGIGAKVQQVSVPMISITPRQRQAPESSMGDKTAFRMTVIHFEIRPGKTVSATIHIPDSGVMRWSLDNATPIGTYSNCQKSYLPAYNVSFTTQSLSAQELP